jgi:hypothetical protein
MFARFASRSSRHSSGISPLPVFAMTRNPIAAVLYPADGHTLCTVWTMASGRPAITSQRRVTYLACRTNAREHERATQRSIAARLAAMLGCRFAEVRDLATASTVDLGYVVPDVTIASLQAARALGIRGEEDLFGGVVPFPFVAEKTITHPLIDSAAAAPQGWQTDFAERVRDVTLPGWSAFSVGDARAAGRRLLPGGAVRIKLASGIGGAGQSVARGEAELDAQLAAIAPAEFVSGVVLERNLVDVRTYSVGRVRVGSLLASYIGTQRTTRSRHGKEVYGGSSIEVTRGGFEALDRLALEDGARRAIRSARAYHEAAFPCFTGMFASRCNYDVAEGRDASGRQCVGVLEQSWRIGGASGAEVAALEVLHDEPALQTVRASTTELHAPDVPVPEGAILYFSGVDDRLGPITKYAEVHRDGGS